MLWKMLTLDNLTYISHQVMLNFYDRYEARKLWTTSKGKLKNKSVEIIKGGPGIYINQYYQLFGIKIINKNLYLILITFRCVTGRV